MFDMFYMFYHLMALLGYVAWNIGTIIFYGTVLGVCASSVTCYLCCRWSRPRVVAPPAVMQAVQPAMARPPRRTRANNHW
jgi:hypothetical protein